MPGCAKRLRAPNFTADEKSLLLTLVYNRRQILENKKTDGVTNREKEHAWGQIGQEFHAQSPAGIHRSVDSLQKLYNNLKKQVRKDYAEERLQRRKTGGGPVRSLPKNPHYELTLASMNKHTVVGLSAPFGGDADSDIQSEDETTAIEDDATKVVTSVTKNVDINSETFTSSVVPRSVELPSHSFMDVLEDSVQSNSSNEVRSNQHEEDQITPHNGLPRWKLKEPERSRAGSGNDSIRPVAEGSAINWGDYKMGHLKKTSSAKLKIAENWKSRRRPVLQSLHSSNVTKSYDQLAAAKLELVKLEIAARNKRDEREEIEHNLLKTSMQLDIQLKLAYLAQLQTSVDIRDIPFPPQCVPLKKIFNHY